MAAVFPAAILVPPFISQPQNDLSYPSNLKLSLPLRKNNEHALHAALPYKNPISLSTNIATLSHSVKPNEALTLFENMLSEGLRPNGFELASLLKASHTLRDVGITKQLHGWCIRAGFGLDVSIKVNLITCYSHRGTLNAARQVFNETLDSCNDMQLLDSMMAAYVLHELWSDAICLFSQVLSIGVVSPSTFTYSSILKACGSAREEKYGMMIHGRMLKEGLVQDTRMSNCLLTFYAKCGRVECANELFERNLHKDVASWNSLIAANEQDGKEGNAVNLFRRMIAVGAPILPNSITFLSVISAVSKLSALDHGREIHAYVTRLGLDLDTSIANSLINMYSKSRKVNHAKLIFERLVSKDVVTWNSMLAAYEQNRLPDLCFDTFRKMLRSGLEADSYSFTTILSAASLNTEEPTYLRSAKEIHGHLMKRYALGISHLPVSNAILSVYGKFHRVVDAENIFKEMKLRDSYSWNAMMDCYSNVSKFRDAFKIFMYMLKQRLSLDYASFSVVLTSCGRMASLPLGQQFHSLAVKFFSGQGSANNSSLLPVNNAFIFMYSKCGSITDAARVFSTMERMDVFSWTSMITGYAEHGLASESIRLFQKMKKEGIEPNRITFLGLLTACAHNGLVEEGVNYFESMSKDYKLYTGIEHYACMVDLFSRSGQFNRAKNFVESAVAIFGEYSADMLNLWRVLLGACHTHKNLELGVETALKILKHAPHDETTYILLSNLYAYSGQWEKAIKVRKSMCDKGLKKEVGCSWIDAGNRRHKFVAGDIFHPWRKEIYEKLEELNSKIRPVGYVPVMEVVLHDMDEMQKEAVAGYHSEKLAVSFGLLHSRNGNKNVIRVIKNLRVCKDCHNWMKLTSLVERKDIILRDSRRYHLFKNGTCSCGDFW